MTQPTPKSQTPRPARSQFFKSPSFKFIVTSVLSLALMIPLLFIVFMVSERENYARKARVEIGRMWAKPQMFAGPIIRVPLRSKHVYQNKSGVYQTKTTASGYGFIRPDQLSVKGNVQSKVLKRGIHEIPVYTSELAVKGVFKPADAAFLDSKSDEILWNEAVLFVAVSDTRGIGEASEIKFGTNSARFRPSISRDGSPQVKGIHIPLSGDFVKKGFPFSFDVTLKGSQTLKITPSGGDTKVHMISNWPHPSFQGAYLPLKRTVSAKGFEANWNVTRLATAMGQTYVHSKMHGLVNVHQFTRGGQNSGLGVRFFEPANHYFLIQRAMKYALGFIGIAFMTVFIMEMKSKRHVHWIQYVFVGLALVIFYMVLLGLSEHLGFNKAYLLASIATVGLIGLYTKPAFHSASKGLWVGAILSTIYGLLYMLLRAEDYAMLIGALLSFSLLALMMFVTRNLDWSTGADPDKLEASSGS